MYPLERMVVLTLFLATALALTVIFGCQVPMR
jgi:hypothetical protein